MPAPQFETLDHSSRVTTADRSRELRPARCRRYSRLTSPKTISREYCFAGAGSITRCDHEIVTRLGHVGLTPGRDIVFVSPVE